MDKTASLDWDLPSDHAGAWFGFAVAKEVTKLAKSQLPELADLFPLSSAWDLQIVFKDQWFAARIRDRGRSGVPNIDVFEASDLAVLDSIGSGLIGRGYEIQREKLGSSWFGPETFAYVGPFGEWKASWQDVLAHLVAWLNAEVLPHPLELNRARVLRAAPPPPQFKVAAALDSLWVLECPDTHSQGTAFDLGGIGVVTCAHVLGPSTFAFRPKPPFARKSVRVLRKHDTIDLAVLEIADADTHPLGSAAPDSVELQSHLLVTGLPNYRLGDTGVVVPGRVVGFRTVSGIRRVLTDAPIVAGGSGGPVLGPDSRVIGIAVTGADRMENAPSTENHGIIPVEALGLL